MNLSEDQIIEKYAKKCGPCLRNTLLPYESELSCVSCGYKVIKRKHELIKKQLKKKFCQSIKICQTQNFLFLCRYIKSF